MLGGSYQTRLGQLTVKKYRTISADLVREYGTHLEKTRKSLLAVARLQSGSSSRASLQANSQTPDSPPPCVDGVAVPRARYRDVLVYVLR